MGISTDAILCYGIQIEGEGEFLEIDGKDYDELSTDLIEIVQHCYIEYPMFIVALKSSVTTAYRGMPKSVKTYSVSKYLNDKLVEYCEEYNIETVGKPDWWLISNWS